MMIAGLARPAISAGCPGGWPRVSPAASLLFRALLAQELWHFRPHVAFGGDGFADGRAGRLAVIHGVELLAIRLIALWRAATCVVMRGATGSCHAAFSCGAGALCTPFEPPLKLTREVFSLTIRRDTNKRCAPRFGSHCCSRGCSRSGRRSSTRLRTLCPT